MGVLCACLFFFLYNNDQKVWDARIIVVKKSVVENLHNQILFVTLRCNNF